MTTLVSARRLEWSVGAVRILGPIDLDVECGECVAVIGPNGAGKTTLLRLLTGLTEPTAGSLEIGGETFSALSRRQLARRIAYVPQFRRGSVPLSVEEMVFHGRYPHLPRWRAPAAADFAAVRRALERVGVVELRERPLATLSGGERQSVYIASALAQESELIVLDEPTTHLDPGHQRAVAALLSQLHAEDRRTIVTATHDLNFASRVADRLVALRDGEILASGPPRAVLIPATLERLFDSPFDVVRSGERPAVVVDMTP